MIYQHSNRPAFTVSRWVVENLMHFVFLDKRMWQSSVRAASATPYSTGP